MSDEAEKERKAIIRHAVRTGWVAGLTWSSMTPPEDATPEAEDKAFNHWFERMYAVSLANTRQDEAKAKRAATQIINDVLRSNKS